MANTPIPRDIVDLATQIRNGDTETLRHAKEHCSRNMRQAIEPFQENVTKHERLLFGQYGDGGLVADVRDHGTKIDSHDNRMKAMEDTAKGAWGAVNDLVNELREETTRTGRTPRHGTRVEIGERPAEEDGSTFKFTLPKKLWPLLLLAVVGGPSAVGAVIASWTQAPQAAVTVAAEGVVTMQDKAEEELARARRVAAEAEAKAASVVASAEAKAARTVAEAEAKAARERAVRPPPPQVAPEPAAQ